MSKTLVFLPASLYNSGDGYLYGVVKETVINGELLTSTCFYILGVHEASSNQGSTIVAENGFCTLGFYEASLKSDKSQESVGKTKKHWVHVKLEDSEMKIRVSIVDRSSNNKSSNGMNIIVYDDKILCRSELLLNESSCNFKEEDHFGVLAKLLREHKRIQNGILWSITTAIIGVFIKLVSFALRLAIWLQPVLKYTALGSQLHSFLETLVWALTSIRNEKMISLKVGNYLLATAVDIFGGVLLLHALNYIDISTPPSEHLLHIAKDVVDSLQDLLHWLSGSPAGLKLNGAFNLMMSRFFVYHINLWWIFLSVTKPLLELAFQIFLLIGQLGFTFQAAILADLLALVSFHIYCIYVYAARLYNLQLSGLLALWRLFLGRKRNPLRMRVDSCRYSADQLFVGTFAFTILLFLLPTTLLYYIVFTTMRLVILCLGGVLTQAIYLLRSLPLYATIHWLFGSSAVCKSIFLAPRSSNGSTPLVLFVTPVAQSWWKTVSNCVPDTLVNPPELELGQLIHKLTFGELIHFK